MVTEVRTQRFCFNEAAAGCREINAARQAALQKCDHTVRTGASIDRKNR
jgi:hypothetical protein